MVAPEKGATPGDPCEEAVSMYRVGIDAEGHLRRCTPPCQLVIDKFMYAANVHAHAEAHRCVESYSNRLQCLAAAR